MTDDTPPAPLLPSDVDLREFDWMPLVVRRYRDSRLIATCTGDEIVAATLLWSASWHQVPAASLPNDDAELAQLAGYGRAVKEFKRHREGATHGLVLCSDNRYWHHVVAEKAADAWNGKRLDSWRRKNDAVRKENKDRAERKQEPLPISARPAMLIRRNTDKLSPWVYDDSAGIPTAGARKSKRKGEGEGEGKRDSKNQGVASQPLSGLPPDATPNRQEHQTVNGHDRSERTRALRAEAVGILEFLNEKTGRHYEPVPPNVDPIVSRLKDGFKPIIVRQVIAKKAREWGSDEKMEQYLRPKTLFNATNFANYAGEIVETPDEASA